MSRKIPNQKKKYKELEKRINTYTLELERIFETLNTEAARLALTTSYDNTGEGLFSFKDFPETKYGIERLQEQYVNDIRSLIYSSTSQEWHNSNLATDLMADGVLKSYTGFVNRELHTQYYQANSDVLKAFQQRKDRGLSLSSKLWKQSQDYRNSLESVISLALERGTSAVTLSKQISKYLKDYLTLQKDYKEKYGKAAKIYDCEYRSARLARSEINIAYRTAEQTRWGQMDFVIGYEVKLSNNHNCKGVPKGQFVDICDYLAGKYPKDFKFVGWHPQCYSDDSEVLTNNGWKLFKDVLNDDLILSLNPTNRGLEYVSIVDRQCWHHKGVMYHFHNKSLDCLVTPEHSMVYLNKTDGVIKRCEAKEFRMAKGAFYRGCLYHAEDVQTITIGRTVFAFDWFCEFMGYWLSDGSTIRKSEISISQQDGEKAKDYIVSCIKNGGFNPHVTYAKIEFYCTDLCQYLKRFGKCIDKYVPNEIKNSSSRQIKIFLDAFIKCDGNIRQPKSFVGNRGNQFVAKGGERMYFTTSKQMVGDLSELILKIGKRPSFGISLLKVSVKKDGSVIKSNYDCYRISECNATTATVFEKETIDYDANVYDLTLERNHIMYIRRNGKCFWGSNCRCYTIPILKTDEEYLYDLPGKNEVKDVPDGFKKWMNDNSARYAKAKERGTLPYFIRDNFVGGDIAKGLKFATFKGGRTKWLTEEQKESVRERWAERQKRNSQISKMANNVLKVAQEYPEIDLTALQSFIDKRNIASMNTEARSVAKQIVAVRKDEQMLSALIPDVHEWKKQFTSAELHEVYDAVEKKIEAINGKALNQYKFKTHLEQELADFDFEIKYVEDPTKYKAGAVQYKTWKVSQAAYAKQHAKVADAIDWENINTELASITSFKTKSKPYLDLVDTLQEAISNNDKSLAQKTILDIKAKRAELDKAAMARQRKKLGNIKPTNLPDMSKEEIDRLLDLFNNETMDDADRRLRVLAEQAWATLTDEEKLILTKYTQTYCYLNEPLRGLPYYGSLIPNADHIHDLPILTSALEKFKMPQNIVVRRGVNNYAIPELGYDLSSLKVGDVFTDKGFLSTAVHRNKGFHQDYNLVICVPKGAKGFYAEPLSHYTDYCRFDYKTKTLWDGKSVETIGGEAEWIGQRGSQFKVLKKSGKTIYLQMIGQLQ